MKKRGQVTTFIIIGIILVFVIAGVFIVYNYYLKSDFEKQLTVHSELPRRIQPISENLDACVTKLTKDALNIVGMQGGYLDLPQEQMPTTPFSPLSSNLEIVPGSNIKTAVWYRERPNGIPVVLIPTQTQVEQEISTYILENFNTCLFGLDSFKDQGFTINMPSQTPSVVVKILQDTVQATVDYPIEVEFENIKAPIESHFANFKTKFGELFSLSKEIFESENEKLFLENKTVDMLIAYDKEIPFSGMELSCVPRIWSKPEITTKVKEALFNNVAAIKVTDTNYELQQNSYKYFEEDVISGAHKDTNVNFMYIPSWPTTVEITPSDGNVLKSDTFTNKLGTAASMIANLVCINSHHFIYTIKYPVLISLSNEDGSIFQFATEVVVDKNSGRKSTTQIPETTEVDAPICDYNQQDVEIDTVTYAGDNEIPLQGAEVSLKCYPASCPLGTSSRQGQLQTKAPLCFNGIIEATKEGYHVGKQQGVSTNQGPQYAKVALEPIIKKSLRILIIDQGTGETREPYESEQVFISFNNKELGYSTYFTFPSDTSEVELIAGNYEIQTTVLGQSTWPITTPKTEVEHCVDITQSGVLGLFGATEKRCATIETEKMELESAVKGGVNFEWTLDRKDLVSEAPLTIYTMAQPIPGDLDSMLKIQEQIDLNNLDPKFQYPTI